MIANGLDSADAFFDATFEKLSVDDLATAKKEFEKCEFRGCTFSKNGLMGARLIDTTFTSCNLSGASLDGASFLNVRFVDCKLVGSGWSSALWSRLTPDHPVRFEGCQLDYSTFAGLRAHRTLFRDCMVREADFAGADLSGSDFSGSDLGKTRFDQTNLTDAHLERASNYWIDLNANVVKGALFSLPEAVSLLVATGIRLDDD